MREEMSYLKDTLHRAHLRYDSSYNKLSRLNKIKKRHQKKKKIGKIGKCRNEKRRKKQLKDFQESREIRLENEKIQAEIDNAKAFFLQARSDYLEARFEFDNYALWISGLYDDYFDNFAVRAELNNPEVSIYFGGDGGDPFGKNHGHYIINVDIWQYTYRRDVGEPHSPHNHIRIYYEEDYRSELVAK